MGDCCRAPGKQACDDRVAEAGCVHPRGPEQVQEDRLLWSGGWPTGLSSVPDPGTSVDKGLEVRVARCVPGGRSGPGTEWPSEARYREAWSLEAQAGGLIRENNQTFAGWIRRQTWRQGGWEEAFPGRRPLPRGFSFPSRFVLISGHSSLCRAVLVLHLLPAHGCLEPSTPSWRWKEDAGHSFLNQAIDANVRQGLNTSRGRQGRHCPEPFAQTPCLRPQPASEPCGHGPRSSFSGLDWTWHAQHGPIWEQWASRDSTSCL